MDKIKILIVDDESLILKLYQIHLSEIANNIILFIATTGSEALSIINTEKPDLILLDVNLPDISGTEICRIIKDDPLLKQTFVVMISGKEISSAAQVKGLSVGADAYLLKPIEKDEFCARINPYLRIIESEKKLNESNFILSTVVDNTGALIAYLDTNFNFIKVNKAYAQADGKDEFFFIGKNHFDLYPDDDNKKIFLRAKETGLPYKTFARPFKYRYNNERGITYWDWALNPIKDTGEKVKGFVLTLTNVTGRVKSTKKIQENEKNLQAIYDASSGIIFLLDVSGKIITANNSLAFLFNTTVDKLIGVNIFDILNNKHTNSAVPAFQQILSTGKEIIFEHQLFEKIYSISAYPIFEDNGSISRIAVIGIDLTEKKKAEHDLLVAEIQYRQTIDTLYDPLYIVDSGLRLVYINLPFENWLKKYNLGLSKSSNLLADCFPYLDKKVFDEYHNVFKTGEIIKTEETNYIDGQNIYTETSKIPIVVDGKVIQVLAIIHDVTEKKELEINLKSLNDELEEKVNARTESLNTMYKELEEKEKNLVFSGKCFQALTYISQMFLSLENFDNKIIKSFQALSKLFGVDYISIAGTSSDKSAFCEIYKYDPYQIETQPIDIFPGSELKWLENKMSENKIFIFANTKIFSGDSENEKKFFKNHSIESAVLIPYFDGNKFTGFIMFCNRIERIWIENEINILTIAAEIFNAALKNRNSEITLKNSMIQMARNERLSTLGTMVAGIAHEINNPNTFLSLNLPTLENLFSLLKTNLVICDNKKNSNNCENNACIIHKDFKINNFSITEILQDINDTIGFIKTGSDRIQIIVKGLREFSQQGLTDLQHNISIKDIIEKAYSIAGATTRRLVEKITIFIEANIPLINGNIIELEQVIINLINNSAQAAKEYKNSFIKIECRLYNNNIRICVMDNGCGISAKNIANIFEPFFSTKLHYGGTGLGLSIVYGIIKKHSGKIYALSEENYGTIFIIDLPAANSEVDEVSPLAVIVDDSEDIINLARSFLKKNNLNAVFLTDPTKVLEMITLNKHIDIIITDFTMPEMNGLELMHEINRDYPWIKFICISGFDIDDKKKEAMIKLNCKTFLTKPLLIQDFIDCIREIRNFAF